MRFSCVVLFGRAYLAYSSAYILFLYVEQIQACEVHMQATQLPAINAVSGHGLCSHAWPVLSRHKDIGVSLVGCAV